MIINVGNVTVGNHTVEVIYSGDGNYTGYNNKTSIVVEKLDSSVNVTVSEITYGDDSIIAVNVPISQTGYVTINIDGNNLTQPIVGGKAVFNVTGLNAGEYTVNVTYNGDNNYAASKNTTTFKVNKKYANVDVVGQNVTAHDNISFIYTTE